MLRVKDPYASFTVLLTLYEKMIRPSYTGISDQAFIHAEAKVDSSCYIAFGAYISKGAHIEAGVEIHPHVFIGEGVHIEKDSIV